MNVQHSSESNEHYTPLPIITLVRTLFEGSLDLDSFSSLEANKQLGAKRIYTKEDNALTTDWIAESVFCNPPGGRTDKNKSMQATCWRKMYSEYQKGNFIEGVFLGFSLEILSKCGSEMLKYPFCIPQPDKMSCVSGSGRIKFDTVEFFGNGFMRVPSTSPPHGNVLVYLPPKDIGTGLIVDKVYLFKSLFSLLGEVVIPQ